MSRVLVEYIIPLLLPTVAWLIWWQFRGRYLPSPEGAPNSLREGPWFWLLLSGLLLTGASLVATALFTGYDAGGRYVPPHWEGGQVVPGRVE